MSSPPSGAQTPSARSSDAEPSSPSQLPKAKMTNKSPSIASSASLSLVLGPEDQDRATATQTTPEQFSTEDEVVALTEFHLFPKLAPELRQMIWKFALPTGHNGERMIPVHVDTDYNINVTGLARYYFSMDKNSDCADRRCHKTYDIGLSAASHESRATYILNLSCSIALDKGLARFSPGLAVYIPDFLHIFVQSDFNSIIKDKFQGAQLFRGVEHLFCRIHLLGSKLLLPTHESKLESWFESLTRPKSVTIVPAEDAFTWTDIEVLKDFAHDFLTAFEKHQTGHNLSEKGPEIRYFSGE